MCADVQSNKNEIIWGKPTCSLQLGLRELINGQALNNLPLTSFTLDWEGEDDVLQSESG